MTWICPYCGTENFRDERIGRREPTCRICGEERTTPEELKKEKERAISKLEREHDELKERASYIREHMGEVQNVIDEYTSELCRLKEELEELRDEDAPICVALAEWEDQEIFYEEHKRSVRAEHDPHQAKLPFEVSA